MRKKDIGLRKKNLNMLFSLNTSSQSLHPKITRKDFAAFSKLCQISSRRELTINAVPIIRRCKNKNSRSAAS
jgi:hypothetical protein